MARLSIPLEANRSRLRACATAAVCWLEGWIGGPCCHAIPAAPGPQVHTRGRHLTVPATTSSSSVVSLVRKGQSLLKLLSRRRQPFACRPRPQHARSQRCATILAPARNRQQAHAAPLARYLANPVWSYGAYFSRNSTHKTQHQTMTCVDDLLLLFFSRESSGASSFIDRPSQKGRNGAQHCSAASADEQHAAAVSDCSPISIIATTTFATSTASSALAAASGRGINRSLPSKPEIGPEDSMSDDAM